MRFQTLSLSVSETILGPGEEWEELELRKRGLIFCFLAAGGWFVADEEDAWMVRLSTLAGWSVIGLRLEVLSVGVDGFEPAGELYGVCEVSMAGRRGREGRHSLSGGGRGGGADFFGGEIGLGAGGLGEGLSGSAGGLLP